MNIFNIIKHQSGNILYQINISGREMFLKKQNNNYFQSFNVGNVILNKDNCWGTEDLHSYFRTIIRNKFA